MGRILDCHIVDGNKYDKNDKIIFHALESATDDDIKIFIKIMKACRTEKEMFKIPIKQMDGDSMSSIEWCVYSRLFNELSYGYIWNEIGDDEYDTSHSPTDTGIKLLQYVDSIKQVIKYGK